MELHTYFWGLLLMKFLHFTPITCPSINNLVNTQGSGTTQATSSRTQPNATVEGTRFTKGMMTIQPIKTFNVTRIRPARIRPAPRMRQAIKKVDRTVHPAITTQLNRGRLYYVICYNSSSQRVVLHISLKCSDLTPIDQYTKLV